MSAISLYYCYYCYCYSYKIALYSLLFYKIKNYRPLLFASKCLKCAFIYSYDKFKKRLKHHYTALQIRKQNENNPDKYKICHRIKTTDTGESSNKNQEDNSNKFKVLIVTNEMSMENIVTLRMNIIHNQQDQLLRVIEFPIVENKCDYSVIGVLGKSCDKNFIDYVYFNYIGDKQASYPDFCNSINDNDSILYFKN